MTREIQKFQVGIKVFLAHRDKLLLLQENSPAGLWELPGGRIDVGEETVPHADVLRREITEELGEHVRVGIGRPCATWTRIRPGLPHVFLVGFHCDLIDGSITLSKEHQKFLWATQEESFALPLAEGYHSALDQYWGNR